MSLPADAVLLPNAVHFKEFYGGFTGTCGETALTAALICAERLPENHDQAVQTMLDITHQMQSMGWAGANGASTLWSLAREASAKRGGNLALEWDYAEPFPHDWHTEFITDAAKKPIVVGLANAQALPGDERGVHYHFVCIVGRCSAGYVVMDGDNWAIEQDFVVYSFENFRAAIVCGVLVLEERVVGVPTGWTDTGSELKNPVNSFVVTGGFYLFVKEVPWDSNDVPVCNAFGVPEVEEGNPTLGAGDIQFFRMSGQLTYTTARNVFRTWNGQEMLALRNRPVPVIIPPAVKQEVEIVSQVLSSASVALSALVK